MEPVPRRLMVMRHAKSSWKSNAPTDHGRPLNKRGKRDAPRVAAHLLSLGWVPDLVTSSDSMRTRSTLERMGSAFPEAYYEFTEEFYHAGLEEVRQAALRVPDDVATWMVLGHNPGWESMAEELTGKAEVLTTANVALLHGSGATWAEALDGRWRLERVVRPRDISVG